MTRRRSPAQKLIGWGILAGAAVVILGIFLITRAIGPATPAASSSSTAAAAALSQLRAALSSSSEPASTPPASSAPASSALTPASSDASAPASSPASSAPASAASSPKVAVVDAVGMTQGARRELLNKLIGQGVLMGVDPFGPPAKVGVTPLFQGLNPDLQLQFLAVVYAYVHNGAAATDALQVVDATNGKVIGNFTNEDGLKTL